jgi:hypothetical protein
MSGQAEQLQQAMAFFKVPGGSNGAGGARARVVKVANKPVAVKVGPKRDGRAKAANLALTSAGEPDEAGFGRF